MGKTDDTIDSRDPDVDAFILSIKNGPNFNGELNMEIKNLYESSTFLDSK